MLKRSTDAKDTKPLKLAFEVELILEKSECVDAGQIKLTCSVDDSGGEYDSPFNIKVVMRGLFSTRAKVSSEKMEQVLKVNGLAAMLPFLRSAVADLSKISNTTNTPRFSEVCGLTWDDIDFDKKIITLDRQIVYISSRYIFF